VTSKRLRSGFLGLVGATARWRWRCQSADPVRSPAGSVTACSASRRCLHANCNTHDPASRWRPLSPTKRPLQWWPGAKSDPYAVVNIGISAAATRVVQQNLEPTWEETFFLFVRWGVCSPGRRQCVGVGVCGGGGAARGGARGPCRSAGGRPRCRGRSTGAAADNTCRSTAPHPRRPVQGRVWTCLLAPSTRANPMGSLFSIALPLPCTCVPPRPPPHPSSPPPNRPPQRPLQAAPGCAGAGRRRGQGGRPAGHSAARPAGPG
jgi:hypothetical protein